MKKFIIILSVVILILVGLFLAIQHSFLPEKVRNSSTTDIYMKVELEDLADRTPIIRTFTKEEFESFSERKIAKIKEEVNGTLEGDIPQLVIDQESKAIEIFFEREVDSKMTIIKPDSIPEIKLSVIPTIYSEEEPVIFRDLLTEESDSHYLYEIGYNYLDGKGIYDVDVDYSEMEKNYREAMFIQVDYSIDNTDYVSIFALNTLKFIN